ncbi:MAG: hypothetical protein CMK96_03525 [Pseudomonas sp.]|jgi:hypothetical protein|nr:hypothetical protein [Pseudomonas sp.]|tara:strand:- start:259 stop:831 length:573 start_codon:yes stop_codon:yes gene_type:complete
MTDAAIAVIQKPAPSLEDATPHGDDKPPFTLSTRAQSYIDKELGGSFNALIVLAKQHEVRRRPPEYGGRGYIVRKFQEVRWASGVGIKTYLELCTAVLVSGKVRFSEFFPTLPLCANKPDLYADALDRSDRVKLNAMLREHGWQGPFASEASKNGPHVDWGERHRAKLERRRDRIARQLAEVEAEIARCG